MRIFPSANITCLLLCLLFVFGSVCSPPIAKTQEDSLWQDLGLYGGQILSIAADSGSSLFVGSYLGGGLFKSIDRGMTWIEIPWFKDTEVFDIAIDSNNPGTVWVANNQFINVTRDYGASWSTFYFAEQESRFCYSVSVDPHDTSGDTIYVGTGGPDGEDTSGAVFKTTDGGNSWFKTGLTADFNILRLSINPNKPGEVWAASAIVLGEPQGTLYATPDGGVSWDRWDIGWYIEEVLVNPEDPMIVFAAGEHGLLVNAGGINPSTTWKLSTVDRSCRALCISSQKPAVIYAGLVNMTAKSTDNGTFWDYYTSDNVFLSLMVDPLNPAVIYGGDVNRGVFKSFNGAQQWEEANNGIRANHIYSIAVSPLSTDTLLTATLSGIYIFDKNLHWKIINQGQSESVSFHPSNENIIYAGFNWKIGKSTDRGITWSYQPVSLETDAHDISSIAVSSQSPELVLAGIYFYSGKRGEIIKSTDSGNSFSKVWETSTPVNTVKIHPANPQFLLAGTGGFYAPVAPGALFISTDGGSTWEKSSLKNVIVNGIDISASDPQLMFAGCGGSDNSFAGIYKSTDGGKTWEKKLRGLPEEYAITAIQIDSSNNNIVYAASFYEGIYLSVDGGNYWTKIGLAHYLVYDVNSVQSRQPASTHLLPHKASTPNMPSSTIIAGTTSGIYQFASPGTGIITGYISAKQTGEFIDAADIATTCGSSCLSSDGFYLLLVPAGVHSITVQAAGYASKTVSGITVPAGQSIAYNISLSKQSDNGFCLANAINPANLHPEPT